jgi:hypothetical protein
MIVMISVCWLLMLRAMVQGFEQVLRALAFLTCNFLTQQESLEILPDYLPLASWDVSMNCC